MSKMVRTIEMLESRTLFAVTVVSAVPDQNVRPDAANTLFQLSAIFATSNLDTVTGTVVSFPLSYGTGSTKVVSALNMELFASTPRTAQNFLNYITSNKYDNTIIHRAVSGSLIQGGGFDADGNAIQTNPAIANEFALSPKDANGRVNTRGTVTMAKADNNGGADSATSQWIINLADNTPFDTQSGGYTTFARLFSGSLTTATAIASLPTVNLSATFPQLPVTDATITNPQPENLVVFSDPVIVSAPRSYFTYTVSSSDTRVVSATQDSSGNLVFDYGTRQGTATVSVTATDLTGASVTETVAVTVAVPALSVAYGTTTIADGQSTAVNFGSAFKGQTATRTVLLKNTGAGPLSLSGLTLPTGVSIASTFPSSLAGNASISLELTFDTSAEKTISGNVTFLTDSPNVSDGSFTFPVSLAVGSGVTLGTGGVKSVVYVDADGTKVTYALKGAGSATLGFTGSNLEVNQDAAGKTATVTGNGLLLSSMALAGTTSATALSATTKGGDGLATISSLTSAGPVKSVALSKVIVNGALALEGGASDVAFAGVNGGTIRVGGGTVLKSAKLGAVSNSSSVTLSSSVKAVTATTVADSTLNFGGEVGTLTLPAVANSQIAVAGSLTGVTVKGLFADSRIAAVGAVGKASFGSFARSRLSSGLASNVDVPAAASDFNATSSIASVTVGSKGVDTFNASTIFAARMGKLALGSLTATGGASQIIASVSIAQLAGKNSTLKAFSVKNVLPATDIDAALVALGVPVSRLDVTIVA